MLATHDHGCAPDDAPIRIEDRHGIGGVGAGGGGFHTAVARVSERREQHVALGEGKILVGNVSRQAGARTTWHMDSPPGMWQEAPDSGAFRLDQSSSDRPSAAPSCTPRLASMARASLAQ